MKFKGDIIVTDPCYILTDEDYDNVNYGKDLNKCGFTTYLVGSTGYGDWANGIETENGKDLGDFCADSGQVCVVLKSEVEKYNNKLFTYGDHCYTVVKDFDGEIILDTSCKKWTVIRGNGNFNFHSEEPETDDWEQQYNEESNYMQLRQRMKAWEEKNGSISDLLKQAQALLEENK